MSDGNAENVKKIVDAYKAGTGPESFPVATMQVLLDFGLNAFAAELLAESLVRGRDDARQIEFVLPCPRGKEFNAVAFQLTPLNIGIHDANHETTDGGKALQDGHDSNDAKPV